VERLLLIVLGPTTIGGGNTTIYTSPIGTNGCKTTTLLEGALTNIHPTSITHPVGLASAIFGAEAILHEFLISLCSYLRSNALCVGTVMTVDTWGWAIVIHILFIVAITLESSGVLGHCLSTDESLSAIET
jgi:hypothetical protein